MDILGGGLVGRPAQEIGKLFDVADILVVRLGAEPADRHVLDQSPAERTDGLVGHWGLLSWVRSSAPRSQDRTPASATPRDPSLATNYRGSGLVHRRIYVIPDRFGDGRLTDPTAAARRKPRPALSDRRQGLRPGEPPEGKLDGSEGDEGGEGFSEVLEILGKPPVAAEPGEGALDHPTAR